MRGQQVGELIGVARMHTAPVPDDRRSQLEQLAPVRDKPGADPGRIDFQD
jgi:hypothetical protein